MFFRKILDSITSVFKLESPEMPVPVFMEKEVSLHRYHFLFYGDVQGVGFRFEMYQIATKIGITGWSSNLPDGTVEAEVQASDEKIDFLIKYMCSIKRIHIHKFDKYEIKLQSKEEGFVPRY